MTDTATEASHPYNILRGLYFGAASNADLSTAAVMSTLHVSTGLDQLIPSLLRGGLDVVLTGNPGDGKSHLAKSLLNADSSLAQRSEVCLDLSARPTGQVIEQWRGAAAAGRPFLLCANEAPLRDLLVEVAQDGALAERGVELRGQLGRLVTMDPRELPPKPRLAALVDLADRNVLDEALISTALGRVCHVRFLPPVSNAADTSVGRHLVLLARCDVARHRLARVLATAGRQLGEHITFRQLWQAVAFALTGGKAASTVRVQEYSGIDRTVTSPLDNLVKGDGKGRLVEAVRVFGDPALVIDPDLDEDLWALGRPRRGAWLLDDLVGEESGEPPVAMADAGNVKEALEKHARLKRLVALAHDEGDRLIHGLDDRRELPSALLGRGAAARTRVVTGLRRLYLSGDAERALQIGPTEGLPLWVSNTYQNVPGERRPHVTVTSIDEDELEVLGPSRATWLGNALGPPPDLMWLHHPASGIALRIDASLLALLEIASSTSGPLPLPEPIQRFLTRLAGWVESHGAEELLRTMTTIDRPRGSVIASVVVRRTPSVEGASYG